MLDRFLRGPFAALRPSVERIRRADPFLMAAAIAYNGFLAIVPLIIAMVTALSFFGNTAERLEGAREALLELLPEDIADLVIDLIDETSTSLGDSQAMVIVIALLVALYAGSRAIYAIVKSLRLMEGELDERGWAVVRGLGVVFTILAGIALIAGQLVMFLSEAVAAGFERFLGVGVVEELVQGLGFPLVMLWTTAVLGMIYRFGPPKPAPRPWWSALVAAVLSAISSTLFGLLLPYFGGTTIGLLGAVGVALIWLYMLGFIVITVPDLVDGTMIVARGWLHRRR